MSIQRTTPQKHNVQADIVLPFTAIDHASLSLVGGKAANLGEMIRAGLPVPPGFCVTTAAYTLVAGASNLEPILAELTTTPVGDTARLTALASAAREKLLATPIPASISEAIIEAYRVLGDGVPVAVRSSATAEDLPFASFAGQQDTYLNILGEDALVAAVRRCWASLWTDRAVSYRASNAIDPHNVRLAVAVQRMVDATVAGILFTANPLTGKRRQAVIDASPGLGEAVVSGAVNPDHFVVNTAGGEIVERRLGDKRVTIQTCAGGGTRRVEQSGQDNAACLSDEQVRTLANLGTKVEAHYGAPQDTEWAIDASGHLWLTQARPITTLFPLPATAPATDDVLRVYFSLNVVQGVYRAFTPMGLSFAHLFGSSMASAFGMPPRDRLIGPAVLSEAASRLFLDVTVPLRSAFGRRLLIGAAHIGEARSAGLFEQLTTDPRLSLVPARRWRFARTFAAFMAFTRAPLYLPQALLQPQAAVARVQRISAELQQFNTIVEKAGPAGSIERLATLEQFLLDNTPRILGRIAPTFICGLLAHHLAGRLLNGLATPDELQSVLRGLPHNPTTEMDLALWELAQHIQSDAVAARYLCETPLAQQGDDYRAGSLPHLLQQELSAFLEAYGHRGVAEIDVGLPRWSEDPTHLLGALANYLQLSDPNMAPDVQFQRGAREAAAMATVLTRRATRKGRLRGLLVGFLLNRTRQLAGMREMPKFCVVSLLARAREQLWLIGEKLTQARRLEQAGDIFFISLSEAQAALLGTDMRPIVQERHATYEHELKRRHIPRVLLSDGTEPAASQAQAVESAAKTLRGTPASSGVVSGKARVILDPTGAHLEPGEILVAPSTDPGWTPLFLTAGGLIMEMGGAISHGAVVAREYGIPAIVGVPGATEHIATGQHVTIDGSTGIVTLEEDFLR